MVGRSLSPGRALERRTASGPSAPLKPAMRILPRPWRGEKHRQTSSAHANLVWRVTPRVLFSIVTSLASHCLPKGMPQRRVRWHNDLHESALGGLFPPAIHSSPPGPRDRTVAAATCACGMSQPTSGKGAGAGPSWVRRTYEAVHAEAERRLPDADARGGAPRWHYAEEGGYEPNLRPPEPLARGPETRGAGQELAAALASRGTSPVDKPPFDENTQEGRKLNAMAERLKMAYLSLGRTLGHYNPTSHTVYIMGRPVQVQFFWCLR